MKILHVITLAELGGAQSVVLNLAKESILHGDEVMVASSACGELWNVLPSSVKQYKIQSLHRNLSLTNDIAVVSELRKINAFFKPDVVHLHSSKIGILGRLAFQSSKIVYTVHGFDSIRIGFPKFLPLERALQSLSRFTVGVSKYDLANLAKEGIRKNVTCIYNGIVDCREPGEKSCSSRLAEMENQILATTGFKVMCIARISPQKRFDLFCEIARQMSHQDIHFFWIGNKEEVTGLPANVHCLGQVENAHQLLKYTDVFVLPTNYEGMPISIIEALCYSVPVIASHVGGVSEMLDGTNGVAIENKSEAFKSAILRYYQDPDLLITARLAARRSYEEHFTIAKMFSGYLELYHSIKKRTGRTVPKLHKEVLA